MQNEVMHRMVVKPPKKDLLRAMFVEEITAKCKQEGLLSVKNKQALGNLCAAFKKKHANV